MKNILRNSLLTLALLLCLPLAASAQSFTQVTMYNSYGTVNGTVGPGTTLYSPATFTDFPVSVAQNLAPTNTPVSLVVSVLATNASSTGIVLLNFAASPDGTKFCTNATTTFGWQLSIPFSALVENTFVTNFPPQFSRNMTSIRLLNIPNADTNTTNGWVRVVARGL